MNLIKSGLQIYVLWTHPQKSKPSVFCNSKIMYYHIILYKFLNCICLYLKWLCRKLPGIFTNLSKYRSLRIELHCYKCIFIFLCACACVWERERVSIRWTKRLSPSNLLKSGQSTRWSLIKSKGFILELTWWLR
jgi:hypothetical protein